MTWTENEADSHSGRSLGDSEQYQHSTLWSRLTAIRWPRDQTNTSYGCCDVRRPLALTTTVKTRVRALSAWQKVTIICDTRTNSLLHGVVTSQRVSDSVATSGRLQADYYSSSRRQRWLRDVIALDIKQALTVKVSVRCEIYCLAKFQVKL